MHNVDAAQPSPQTSPAREDARVLAVMLNRPDAAHSALAERCLGIVGEILGGPTLTLTHATHRLIKELDRCTEETFTVSTACQQTHDAVRLGCWPDSAGQGSAPLRVGLVWDVL